MIKINISTKHEFFLFQSFTFTSKVLILDQSLKRILCSRRMLHLNDLLHIFYILYTVLAATICLNKKEFINVIKMICKWLR